MIKIDELRDWLAESERTKSLDKIESYIDSEIKRNVLNGETSFCIATGRWGKLKSEKTKFYELWYDKNLSKPNQEIVQNRIIKKYQEHGFHVVRSAIDTGWNNSAFALKFVEIDKILQGDNLRRNTN